MLYKVHDTIGLTSEEKLEFFEESFSYRLNYLKKKIDMGEIALKTDYEWLMKALSYLKQRFYSEELFYYAETQYVLIAQK